MRWRGGWRTHQVKPGVFDTCQDVKCPETHYISTVGGSREVTHEWDGMLDSDGKVGK